MHISLELVNEQVEISGVAAVFSATLVMRLVAPCGDLCLPLPLLLSDGFSVGVLSRAWLGAQEMLAEADYRVLGISPSAKNAQANGGAARPRLDAGWAQPLVCRCRLGSGAGPEQPGVGRLRADVGQTVGFVSCWTKNGPCLALRRLLPALV